MAIFKNSEIEVKNESEQKASVAIKNYLDSCDLGVKNLQIEFIAKEAKVIARGEVENSETISKISEILEAIEGVSLIENLIELKSKKTQEDIFHIVQAGETLEAISKIYFGTEDKAEDIYQANSENLDENKKLYSGLKLKIPTKS